MMDENRLIQTILEKRLASAMRYFAQIGSTNDEALNWAAADAPDGALVIANDQTAGRGRLGRSWVTRPGAALAFSVIYRPSGREAECLHLFSPLAALALHSALQNLWQLPAQIKWPNDVLLQRRKTAGILAEAAWLGSQLQGVVVGVGINVLRGSVPPDAEVMFPATSVEHALGQPPDRLELLCAVLRELQTWRAHLGAPAFFDAWRKNLAFMGEQVCVDQSGNFHCGTLSGIDGEGNILLRLTDGQIAQFAAGDISLRPLKAA
jgi:BirA family biotin operon repressor/biotin-[acetyl-CoA-carboxylase] ligase